MDSLDFIKKQAWEVRNRHQPVIYFPVPGVKYYENRYYRNSSHSFAHVSITGSACHCKCAHCNGKLLETMAGAETVDELKAFIKKHAAKGTRGILVSGGADRNGEVPVHRVLPALAYAKDCGLKVLVHSGLINRAAAKGLKEAGVDQVLMDVIGDEDTIREVYHIHRKPGDYLRSMENCREAGLAIAPHVVLGLHFGEMRGIHRAFRMIRQAGPQAVVLVVIVPKRGTQMADIKPPPLEATAMAIGSARVVFPDIPLTLGCAKPAGRYKRVLEGLAVECGVNAIAYPNEGTVKHAKDLGLKTLFTEECCSLSDAKLK